MDNSLTKTICLGMLTILVSACSSKDNSAPAPIKYLEESVPLSQVEAVTPVQTESPKEILGFYKKESGSAAVNLAFTHNSIFSQKQLDLETIDNTASFIDKKIEFIRYSFGLNHSIYVADFTNSLMFDYGKSSVRSADKSLLDNFAKLYGTEAFGRYLYIIGHTDTDGSAAYNYGLSARRARAVASVLISNGVSESQLSIIPAGEYIPKASNSTDEGKQLNRRVEVISADSRALIQSYLRQLNCPDAETCKRKLLNVFDVQKVDHNAEMNIKNVHSFSSYSPELNNLSTLNQALNDYSDSVE